MDEDGNDIDDWRQVCLGDEPIYCAAPPPPDPDDIICFGSDEELDDAAKVSRRLKYEAQGLRYLQGKPVLILSASLRGPFDKASGWKNPWLPKEPTAENSVLQRSQPTIRPLPAIKQRFRKYFEQDDTTPGTDSSMRCHLPSPESNRDLQLFNDPPETDKHSRIQAWAKEVSDGTVLERDDFWAPSRGVYEDTDEPRRKRPAGREWLKTKPSKRKRLTSSQTTGPVSTPTRKPQAGLPLRSTSLPTSVGQARKPNLPKKINQSFQLSTPLSSNQSGCELPFKGPVEASTHGETMLSQDEESNSKLTPEDSSSSLTSITADDSYSRPSSADGQASELVSNLEITGHSTQSSESTTNEEAQESQGAEDKTGLESYLDQSFHYRARHPKQTTPATGPDVPITEDRFESVQPGTTKSPVHEDTAKVAVAEAEEQQNDIESVVIKEGSKDVPDPMREQETQDKEQFTASLPPEKKASNNGGNDGDSDRLSGRKTEDHAVIIETGSSKDEKVAAEHIPLMHNSPVPILAKTTNSLHIETKVVESKNLDMVHDDSHEFPALREGNMVQAAALPGNRMAVEVYLGKTELLVDEESTLIGDPTDSNGSMSPVINELPTAHDDPDSLNAQPTLTAESHGTAQTLEDNMAQEDESDSESNPVIVPLSQIEWGITEVAGDSTEKPAAIVDNTMGSLAVKVEEVPENDVPIRTTLLDSSKVITQQSPWAPEPPPGADLTIEHIKTEPPADEPSNSPYPSCFTLLTSQLSGHGTPRISASQQSPWGRGLLEPIKLHHDQRLATPTKTTSADTPPIKDISEIHQSPWTRTNTTLLPCPRYPPTLSTPATHDGKMPPPFPQISMMATESDNRVLEDSINKPTTPPPMPTSQMRTPDLEKSIKSFAMFNTPSPERLPQQFVKPYSSTGQLRGILSSAPRSNPWSSRRSSRRVSFASLPNGEDSANTLPALNATRVASPPPETTVDAEDEDVSVTFQNHFEIMKRRASGENVHLRFQPRLLPSSSQQKPMSPAIGAMAEAFQQADAHITHAHEDLAGDVVKEDADQEMPDREQSPWRKESQGVDDVAEVMNNLDEFLSAWDINAELQKARQESSRGYQ
ncbi:hypothetical protein F4776DRAFT_630686 [Hypoxylon sp. NC0597]|nr:hypothetical protein F4776DRAFT_630686 [Hypoxylon sp. NC0597]